MSEFIAKTPDDTFAAGEDLAASLRGGELILLYGGLGAGKTLFTKGIMNGLAFDIDEVTSPSFSLVNLYKAAEFDVYHIDLWRLDGAANPAEAVGLGEILEQDRVVTVIEWADRLGTPPIAERTIKVYLDGDGDQERSIRISRIS